MASHEASRFNTTPFTWLKHPLWLASPLTIERRPRRQLKNCLHKLRELMQNERKTRQNKTLQTQIIGQMSNSRNQQKNKSKH